MPTADVPLVETVGQAILDKVDVERNRQKDVKPVDGICSFVTVLIFAGAYLLILRMNLLVTRSSQFVTTVEFAVQGQATVVMRYGGVVELLTLEGLKTSSDANIWLTAGFPRVVFKSSMGTATKAKL